MAGQTLQIGPFIGGLNTQDDPTSIADEELVDCVNLEVYQNGSLVVRPPIQNISKTGITGSERILLLGVAVFSGVEYIIGSNDGGVFYRTVGDWTSITATFEAAAMVQYDNKVWLVPKIGESNPGGSWDPSGGFVADADIPQGGAAAIYKERMFVAPGFLATTNDSRLRFSDAGLFGNWPAPNFIDIKRGDGQKLVDLYVYKSNLLLFKDHSTFFMAYDGTPFDAVIENINTNIGPSNPYCVVSHENSIFVYQEGRVYELLNFDYQQINIKVPFFFDGSAPSARAETAFLSLVGDRLIARHFNRIYVFGLRTKTWTRWESTNGELHNFGRLVGTRLMSNDEYYGGSAILSVQEVFRIKDELDAATDERNDSTPVDIQCSMRTKNYNLAASHVFKRLNWWGVDILTTRTVTGIVTPIVAQARITWKFLKDNSYKWSDIKGNAWSFPTGGVVFITDPDIVTGTSVTRKFIRFVKALRYRQVNFQVLVPSNGTTSEGPTKIYWLTMTTSTRQVVDKKVA